MDAKVFICITVIILMGMIGLKIKDRTYDRLKWLKTRFEFVHETSMSWDEFFERISRDVLLILAYDLKERSEGKISSEDILAILSGSSGKSEKGDKEDTELFSMMTRDAVQSGDEILRSLGDIRSSVKRAGSSGPSQE